jgi:ABC-2 type transport system ATP-binding protein
MILAEDLRKTYKEVRGLDGFSARVEPGEFVGLVGPNGAGKTTLIKILATLLRPSAGRASVAGHDVLAEPRAVRAVAGYMPDVAGLYQDMRVVEFLEFFADAFHLDEGRKRPAVKQALTRAGLTDRRNSFVEQLSLGLKQRLFLAKTLLHEPKVLLLDEPATGLDPLARIELREQLQHLHREGVTILISSHILSDLEEICTRIIFIANGKNVTAAAAASGTAPSSVPTVRCEIEVAGSVEAAARAAKNFSSARILEARASLLQVEVAGSLEQASVFLRHLLDAGVIVLRYDSHGPGLEDRYRQVFGAPPAGIKNQGTPQP